MRKAFKFRKRKQFKGNVKSFGTVGKVFQMERKG